MAAPRTRLRPTPRRHPSTRDEDEIARFEADAGDWWRSDGAFAALHRLNPVRIAFIRDAVVAHFGRPGRGASSKYARGDSLARPLKGLDVLDVGCGGGIVCEPLARLGARVTGIDAGADNARAAALHARASGLDIAYRAAAPEDLIRDKARFDVVLNMEVIEHVADPGAFVETCAALVRPGGLMMLATLNRTLKSLLLGKIAAEYVLGWIPPGTHDWSKFVRPDELAGMLANAGCVVIRRAGVAFDPWRGEWRLADDLGVNYMMAAAKERKRDPARRRGPSRPVQLSRRGRPGRGKTSMPSSSRRRASSGLASP
jgi:2-polyprenyl-6-hydroxyphenyl methylase/3-demethylubiquinone-9 3-methyltransferase